jgi:dTDP-4-dehydrorhamnose 3,5-epimerase
MTCSLTWRPSADAAPCDTELEGPLLLRPDVFGDERGFFAETYRTSWLAEHGVTEPFVQDNHSRSARGVVRGMHFQNAEHGAAKLVRCGRGAILDVLVDLRRSSPGYRRWEAYELSEENMHVLYVPHGFGHGFVVLSEVADVLYKQTAYYDPDTESEIHYADPDVGIAWPEDLDLQVSARDERAPRLADVDLRFG